MLNKFLICNQYELYGNFEDVRKTEYFERLAEVNGDACVEDENLYRILGYERVGKLSYSDTVALRRLILQDSTDEIIGLLVKNGISVNGAGDVYHVEKDLGLVDLMKKRICEHSSSLIVEMAVQYLFVTKDFTWTVQNTQLTFNEFLNWVTCSNTRMSAGLVKDYLCDKISVIETDGQSFATNGVIYVNAADWKKQKGKSKDFLSAVAKEIYSRKWYLEKLKLENVTGITLLWNYNPAKYTLMLDWAGALGLTLAEFLRFIGAGIRVINQEVVLSEIEMAMYTCGNNVFYAVPGGQSLRKDMLNNINAIFNLRDMNLAEMNAFG